MNDLNMLSQADLCPIHTHTAAQTKITVLLQDVFWRDMGKTQLHILEHMIGPPSQTSR